MGDLPSKVASVAKPGAAGAGGASAAPPAPSARRRQDMGRFVVEVCYAENVSGAAGGAAGAHGAGPKVHAPFAEVWVESRRDRAPRGVVARTPARRKAENPVWAAKRDLCCQPREDADDLVIQVRDAGRGSADTAPERDSSTGAQKVHSVSRAVGRAMAAAVGAARRKGSGGRKGSPAAGGGGGGDGDDDGDDEYDGRDPDSASASAAAGPAAEQKQADAAGSPSRQRGRLLGETRVPVSAVLETPYGHRVGNRCIVVLRRVPPPFSPVKTIFLVRHGQSRWNRAQDEMDLGGLMAFDHGLNEEGVLESRELNRRWQAARAAADAGGAKAARLSDLELAWLNATGVYSSPLTRAIGTAAVALQGHPALEEHGVRLLAAAREIKGIGGIDCVGVATGGEAIARRALDELTRVVGEREARRLMCRLDANDCMSEWWTPATGRDSARDVRHRFENFWEDVRLDTHASAIVVGHSNFGRELCRSYLGAQVDPALAARLRQSKLQNAGVLALRVNFQQPRPVVIEAELLFGSGLADEDDAAGSPAGSPPPPGRPVALADMSRPSPARSTVADQ